MIQRQVESGLPLRAVPRSSPMTAWSGNAARSVVTIAFPASASAVEAISPCSLEKPGRRFKSCAASLTTAAALRAARTATARDGSLTLAIVGDGAASNHHPSVDAESAQLD